LRLLEIFAANPVALQPGSPGGALRSFDHQPTPLKDRKDFVALVCFVVERLWLFLNHE
jgi:hypothetical protein